MKLSSVVPLLLLALGLSPAVGAPKRALCSGDFTDSTVQTTISWVPTAAVANDNGGQVNDHVDGDEGAVVDLCDDSDDDLQLVEDSDDDFSPLALNLSSSDGDALIDTPVSHPREGTGTPTASPPRELSHRDPSSAVRGVLDERRSSNIRDDFHLTESSNDAGYSADGSDNDSTGTCRANDAPPPTNDGGAVPGNLPPPSSDGGIGASSLVHPGGSESMALAKAVPGPQRRSSRKEALKDVSYTEAPINLKMRNPNDGSEYGVLTTYGPPAAQETILPDPYVDSLLIDDLKGALADRGLGTKGDIHAMRRRYLRAERTEAAESPPPSPIYGEASAHPHLFASALSKPSSKVAVPSAQSPSSAQSPPVATTDGEALHFDYNDEAIAGRNVRRVTFGSATDGEALHFEYNDEANDGSQDARRVTFDSIDTATSAASTDTTTSAATSTVLGQASTSTAGQGNVEAPYHTDQILDQRRFILHEHSDEVWTRLGDEVRQQGVSFGAIDSSSIVVALHEGENNDSAISARSVIMQNDLAAFPIYHGNVIGDHNQREGHTGQVAVRRDPTSDLPDRRVFSYIDTLTRINDDTGRTYREDFARDAEQRLRAAGIMQAGDIWSVDHNAPDQESAECGAASAYRGAVVLRDIAGQIAGQISSSVDGGNAIQLPPPIQGRYDQAIVRGWLYGVVVGEHGAGLLPTPDNFDNARQYVVQSSNHQQAIRVVTDDSGAGSSLSSDGGAMSADDVADAVAGATASLRGTSSDPPTENDAAVADATNSLRGSNSNLQSRGSDSDKSSPTIPTSPTRTIWGGY